MQRISALAAVAFAASSCSSLDAHDRTATRPRVSSQDDLGRSDPAYRAYVESAASQPMGRDRVGTGEVLAPATSREARVEALPVAGFGDAIVSVPAAGARAAAKPLVIAAHGAGDSPGAQCAAWRGIVGDRAFVVCPRGTPFDASDAGADATYFFRSHAALAGEVRAALQAATSRYGAQLDASRAVYVGYAQGGILGAHMLAREPGAFAAAVLIEGGHDAWSAEHARRFRDAGGARLAFVCGRDACDDAAKTTAAVAARAGLASRVVTAPGAGHAYAGALVEASRRAFEWAAEGDPRFAK